MDMQGKAKFVWVDDYYHSHWMLTAFETEEGYDTVPGFEMPAEFVAEWAAAHKAVEALEDLLVYKSEDLEQEVQDDDDARYVR